MFRLHLLLLSVLLVVTAGCHTAVKGLYPPEPGQKQHEIYIVNNHWHTGITLNSRDLTPKLLDLIGRKPDSGWIDIGWGDQGFYTAKEVTTGLSLEAMFYSRGSVLHVWTLPDEPRRFYELYSVELYRLHISEAGHANLMKRLEETFATDAAGRSIYIQPGLFDQSDFYLARGRYGVFHTCNHWLADTLRTTGFPITPFWALTADNVGWQINHFGSRYEPSLVIQQQ